MAIYKEEAIVLSNEKLSEGVYSIVLKTKDIAKEAIAGQFVSVYCNDSSRILPRPISLCEIDKNENTIRIVFRTVGKGTSEFAKYVPDTKVTVLGPLGNGYDLSKQYENVLVIGGGIGIPPMLQLARSISGNKQIVVGYRSKNDMFLYKELQKEADVFVATDDGSYQTNGTVIDAIKENDLKADAIMACGPMPMLKALKKYSEEKGIDCFISLEERMACGIGACLGCVTKTKKKDHHSKVHNARICTEGPVFDAREVDI